MKYTKEQRLDIGRKIYNSEITRYQAAEQYDIGEETARSYMRMYRDLNHLPPKNQGNRNTSSQTEPSVSTKRFNRKRYENMSKEELIEILVKERISESK